MIKGSAPGLLVIMMEIEVGLILLLFGNFFAFTSPLEMFKEG